MLKLKEIPKNKIQEEQNKLDLFYCILFLISYLSIKAIIDGNHIIWAAFTQKTSTPI